MRIALKVDVCSRQGAEEGVPKLLELFEQYGVKASFFFSSCLVSDSPGVLQAFTRAKNAFARKNCSEEVSCSNRFADAVKEVAKAGHDVGLKAHDPLIWIKNAAFADQDWTRHQLALAVDSMSKVLGNGRLMFAAAGWQVNTHLLVQEEKLDFVFASDTRGKYPFYPVLQQVRSNCPQIPTTLPTLAEMLNRPDVNKSNVHEYLYSDSRYVLPHGHVYSAQAQQEGMEYLETMEKLLIMWKGQEGELRSLSAIYQELDLQSLPSHQVGWADVEGREGHVAMQSVAVSDEQ